jgi:hypothetical protein
MSRMFFSSLVFYFLITLGSISTFAIGADDTQPQSTREPALEQSTRAMVNELLNQLGQRLKSSLASDGAEAAVSVCKEASPAIAKRLSAEHGVTMTRVGTRVRNPSMGTPNKWQEEALAQFESRLAAGENPAMIDYWKIADSPDGRRELRYAKSIITQPMCLNCHGATSDIPTSLAEKIRMEYPKDHATGYSVGKLRGAVVVTRPLP